MVHHLYLVVRAVDDLYNSKNLLFVTQN